MAAYWAYIDGKDEAGGHGTHVSGSVAGDPRPTITSIKASAPLDAAVFTVGASLAPAARIYFTDVACDTFRGCKSPNSEPSPGCPPTTGCEQSSALWFPSTVKGLFNPPYQAGVRISTNSYGSDGDFSQYTDSTRELDQYVVDHPDFLHLFAASNDGRGNRFSSLSSLAVAKNVVAVGATQDGLLAHQAKIGTTDDPELGLIPALFQGFDGRGCNAVLQEAYVYLDNITFPTATPTEAECAALAKPLIEVFGNGYSDYSDNYIPVDNIDLALCYGCTPRQIMNGLKAQGGNWYSYLTSFVGTYNSRVSYQAGFAPFEREFTLALTLTSPPTPCSPKTPLPLTPSVARRLFQPWSSPGWSHQARCVYTRGGRDQCTGFRRRTYLWRLHLPCRPCGVHPYGPRSGALHYHGEGL